MRKLTCLVYEIWKLTCLDIGYVEANILGYRIFVS